MRYLKYTYVDAVTGVPVTQEPARNGPVPPGVAGLEFTFALESSYPTLTPTLFGVCPDGAITDLPGVLAELSETEYQAALDGELEARHGIAMKKIDAERDRRISAGFEFGGVWYQSRLPAEGKAGDWEVFSGKALEALIAQLNGTQPGDLRWSNPTEDFAWIAADNSRVPMDALTVIALAQAASAHRSRHTFAGSDLKALRPIPTDYTDDKWWP